MAVLFKDATTWMQEMIEKENARKMHDRLNDHIKFKLREAKENYKWTKTILKRMKSLKKEKTIYIYDHHSFEEGNGLGWIDVNIAFRRGFFRQLHSQWVCTLMSRECFESDQKDALESGGEYSPTLMKNEDAMYNFDDMYFDRSYFQNDDEIVEAFKVWLNYFFPEYKDKEVKFEYKEAFLFRSIYRNWKFKKDLRWN